MEKKVNINSQKRILSDFFSVDEAFLEFEKYNGKMSPEVRRLNFDRGDAVAAIIWQEDRQQVLLVEQFRYPAYTKGKGWILEAVAGVLEIGENPDEAIKREILEETGFDAKQISLLNTFYPSPGGSSERIYLYLATVSQKDKQHEGGGLQEENEDIKLVELSIAACMNAMEEGEICDAKTIIGLKTLVRRLGI